MEKILDRVDSAAVERTPIPAPPPPPTDHAYPASAFPWNTSLSHLPNSTYHNTYHPYLELHDMLYALHDAYPDVVTIVEYGRSSEGRPLLGAVIREEDEDVPSDEDNLSDFSYSGSTGRKGEADTKLAFVISGAQHSREVRSPCFLRAQILNFPLAVDRYVDCKLPRTCSLVERQ